MSALHALPDPVDAAIAAAEQPVQVTMGQHRVTLSSGRPAFVVLPTDATDTEVFDLVGVLATQIRAALAEARNGPASRLLVPRR
ncbi:MAG: hypothetical protein ACYDCI_06615 [Candidatus Limnocylindrales bacterium]